ncbi:hypothetical protein KKF32_00845 [Patescibacteria group bacterium]|nr:hypothetical protein [Patescibacteria group bacterium]
MKEGLFIVIYGINNLGKTTQAKKLVESFKQAGLQVEYLKYPIYDLDPTGTWLNKYIRSNKREKISKKELQDIYTKNRFDFQLQLCQKLNEGINIIAEDYSGTGIAWGWTEGVDLEYLIETNKGLVKPDIEILLDGERFLEAKEENHYFEDNEEMMQKGRLNHLQLAKRFGWEVVNANQEIEKVHQDILKIAEKRIKEILEENSKH